MSGETPSGTERWRSRETNILVGAYAVSGYAVTGIGSVLLPLQEHLQVSRSAVAFYPSLYSAFTIIIGLIGGAVIRAFGDLRVLAGAFAFQITGAAIFTVGTRPATMAGVALLGIGGALLAQVMPARMGGLDPTRSAANVARATASASISAIMAPLLIGASLATWVGFRGGYAGPIMLLATTLLIIRLRLGLTDQLTNRRTTTSSTAESRTHWSELWLGLTMVVLAVSAEFTIVYWAASAITEWHRLPVAQGTVAAGGFLIGMAVGRIFGSRLLALAQPTRIMAAAVVVALAGFTVFWTAPNHWLAGAGLLATGLGVSIQYPVAVSRVVAAIPGNRARASQFGALALGLSVAGAPIVLARLAEAFGMRLAYLMVPALLVGLLAMSVLAGVRQRGR